MTIFSLLVSVTLKETLQDAESLGDKNGQAGVIGDSACRSVYRSRVRPLAAVRTRLYRLLGHVSPIVSEERIGLEFLFQVNSNPILPDSRVRIVRGI
jgi:hypothetical protein